MRKIVMLQIVFQRPATDTEIEIDRMLPKDRRNLTGWREAGMKLKNYEELVPVDIAVGETGSTELLKRTILRAVRSMVEPQYKYFYVIAHFEDPENGEEFARTVTPRTEIPLSFRGV